MYFTTVVLYFYDKYFTILLNYFLVTNISSKVLGGGTSSCLSTMYVTEYTLSCSRSNRNVRDHSSSSLTECFTFLFFSLPRPMQLGIRVRLFDQDKYGTDDPLGEVVIPLTEIEARSSLAHKHTGRARAQHHQPPRSRGQRQAQGPSAPSIALV